MKTVSNVKWQFEKNGFDLIRYWAAISVMFLHFTGYVLMLSEESRGDVWKIRQIFAFFPGVVVLFALSGYLVSASMDRIDDTLLFFKKRIMRLFPDLWLVTLVNTVVLLVLVPELLDGSFIVWVLTQIIGVANTPACLKEFATGSVNGALWTVFVEIQLYVVLGVFFPKFKKMKNSCWGLLIALSIVVNILCDLGTQNMTGSVPKLVERIFLPYFLWFFLGVFCYVKKEWILQYKWTVIILLVLYVLIMKKSASIDLPGYYANIAVGILCPFIVVMAGYCLPAVRIKKDITYNIFLYHWIVLNVMVHFGLLEKLDWRLCLLIFGIASIMAAWGSKWLCEKMVFKIGAGFRQRV